MTPINVHAIARTIYPKQYFSLSQIVAFPGLPHVINVMIHAYRDIDEVQVKSSHVSKLLGIGNTLRRDCLLVQILQATINTQTINIYTVMLMGEHDDQHRRRMAFLMIYRVCNTAYHRNRKRVNPKTTRVNPPTLTDDTNTNSYPVPSSVIV
jgi:hypothetical protein